MNTLGDELPRLQEKCRKLLEQALELPPASGQFLVAMLRSDLARAERAAASGDVGQMLMACLRLEEYSE